MYVELIKSMCSACKNVDWNKLRALLNGKMLHIIECTNNIDVDLYWECWLQCYDNAVKTCVHIKKIKFTTRNLSPWFDAEVRRPKNIWIN